MPELDWGQFKPVESTPPDGGGMDWSQFQPVQVESTEPDWADFQPVRKSDSPLANAVRGSGITEAFETNPVIAYGKGAIAALPLMSKGVVGGSTQQLGEAFGGNAPTGAQLKQSEINALNAELRQQGDIIANLPDVAKTPQSARYQYAIKNIESLGSRLKEIEQRPDDTFLSDFESSRLSTERLGAIDIAGGGDFGEPSDVGAEMIAKTGRATFLQAVKEAQALAPKTEKGSATRFGSDLGQATMMMVPAIIASVVTKSPSVGLGLMGYQVKPLDYAQRREQGLLPDQADLESTIVTASEILTEKTPLDLLLSGKGFWKKLLTAAPAEGLQEGLQSAVESLVNAGILNKEMTFGEAWAVMQKPETWKQMGYATALGAAMGATFTGVLHPLTREKTTEPAPEPSIEQQPPIEPLTAAVQPRQPIITPDALIPTDTTETPQLVPATAEEQPIRLPPRAQAEPVEQADVSRGTEEEDAKFSQKWAYSQLARGVESAKQPKAKASEWKAIIAKTEGVKKDEIEAVGLNEWLDLQQGAVTKEQVLEFVRANGVQVKEVVKGQSGVSQELYDWLGQNRAVSGVPQTPDEWLVQSERLERIGQQWRINGDELQASNFFRLSEEANRAAEGVDTLTGSAAEAPKFAKYQLPGGENYKELLLTLPTGASMDARANDMFGRGFNTLSAEEQEALRADVKGAEFRSPHFDEPNVIAHVRFNERPTADGKRVLFIEELQSDWAQKGRKEGFTQPDGLPPGYEIIDDRAEAKDAGYPVTDATPEAWRYKAPDKVSSIYRTRRAAVAAAKDYAGYASQAVPSAPFVTKTEAWAMLAMKRMIRWAVENSSPGNAAWVDVTKPQSAREQLEQHFGSELASMIPLKVMDVPVLLALKNDKVLRAVVEAVPVNVMDILADNGITPESLLREGDVFSKSVPVPVRATVTRGLADALHLVGTRMRTALDGVLSSESRGGDKEVLPAVRASQLDPSVVVGLLSPATLYQAPAGSLAIEQSAAGRGAESTEATLDDARVRGELPAAKLALFLNRHDAIVSGSTSNATQKYLAPSQFEKIAWATGTQQADRYDLSKQIKAIQYFKGANGLYEIRADSMDGRTIIDESDIPASRVEEIVGKDMLKKMDAGEGHKFRGDWKELSGLDLKVGGEGMKAFYDQMLPQMVNKYVKKWGGEVGETQIETVEEKTSGWVVRWPNGEVMYSTTDKRKAELKANEVGGTVEPEVFVPEKHVVHSLDIPPAMRDAAMQGQPLFQVKPDGETPSETKEGGKAIEEPSISTLTQSIRNRIGKPIPDDAFVAVEHPEGFAPAAEAVQAAFGKRIVLIRNNRPDIVDFNGVVIQESPDTIFINEKSDAPFIVTTGHELTHHLRRDRPELYKMLRDAAVPRMQGTEKFKAWLDAAHQRMGIPQATVDTMEEELIADFIGENWQNREFWEAMQKKSPSQFRRLIKAITDWLNNLLDAMRKGRVASQYFKEVEALRDEAAAIFAEYATKSTGTAVESIPAFSQRKFGPLEFPTKDIENAYREASKGLSTPRQALEGVKEWFAYVGHGFTRHYIDMPNNAVFAKAHEILRQYEAAPEASRAKSAAMLREVLHGLNPKQYDLLTRKILLDDLAYRQSIGHELPYGFTEATLKQAKSAVDAAVKQDAAIEQALVKRNQFIKRLTDKLVQEGILKPEQTQNPAYFHHQVLVHARAHELWAKGARRLKKPRPGYAKKAHGSTLDINANYLEAEFAFLSEALLDLRTKETLRKVENAYDITKKLKEQAKEGENWKDLIPEGYEAWQPEKGNLFYSGKVIGERAIEHLLDKATQSIAGIEKAELEAVVKEIKEALIVGAKKKELIIPSELARTLERMRPDIRDGLFDWLFAKPLGAWKVWTLINPRRVLKYNTNNMSGDLDAVIAGKPGILKEFGPSIRELWNGMTNKGVSQDYWDAMDRGVFDSGLTIQEIPDVNKLRQFEHLFSKPKAHEWPPMLAMRAWRVLKDFTQFRENWMRYAAYQYALKRLNKGYTIEDIGYGATHPDMFKGLDKKDTAALWSRNLVGDYGDISHFGQGIRRYAIPFYSFQEINLKRYLTLINNAYRQGIGKGLAKSGVVGAVAGARVTAWLGVRMFMVYMLMQLWNHLLFPDEEEELNTMDKSRLHVILGRDEDGKVRVMRLQGALSDFLGWVGAEDAVSVLREMEKGRASWSDFFKAIAKAPVNKVAGGLSPVIKTPFEYASGRNFYPDVFNSRSSQDKNRDIFRLWSLEHEYDWLTGKPSKGYARSLGPEGLLYATRDPDEGAYYEIQKMKHKFMEGKGIEGSTDFSTPKSRLMREYVMAKRYKDTEAEERIIKDMAEMGVKNKDIRNRLERARPLSGLSRRDRNEFIGTLSPKDKELLRKSERHWFNTYAKPIEAQP